ncbi:hypothetical protein [Paraburkholderia gardini]|uniref:hypothetical protein n=1 Tax=Paraburkholderia gardini TaxID=2823469 RepID=UPI001D8F42D8|nr:hypothetical protein [Paraburkholderia gardini]CAG4889355.1 hypothetical protein R69919_00721 [Paraburkholderia gardini]
MKLCRTCGQEKDLSAFSKCARTSDGLQFKCKACHSEYNRTNKEARSKHAREYYATNKERYAETDKAWREANRERKAVGAILRYRANKEKLDAQNAKWKRENPTATRAIMRKWSQANRATINVIKAKRLAAHKKATPGWANKEAMHAIYAESLRLTRETGIQHHVDHIVPLVSKVVCGMHCEFNLQVLPGLENQSKSNRWWPDMP